jgi:hypothetical protein
MPLSTTVTQRHGIASGISFYVQYQFVLTNEITYDQYTYAVRTKEVPFKKLFPNMYPRLMCKLKKKRMIGYT